MPAYTATAPGKIILFGEHAVVYGQPAIAVPVGELRARVVVRADPRGPSGQLIVQAPDIGLESEVAELPPEEPIHAAVRILLESLGLERLPSARLRISSTIPVSSGLGSSAAVTVALLRALAGFLGQPLPDDEVSRLAFEIEKIHHGTPSGVDNTVVTFERPVFFRRGEPIEKLRVRRSFTLVLGNSGVRSPTAETVASVRAAWQQDARQMEGLFESVGAIARAARQAIEAGVPAQLGPLMDENHELLRKIGVSSPELDGLVGAARAAGALGAKLSGAGRGGHMIAICAEEIAGAVAGSLQQAGAAGTVFVHVAASQ